MNPATNETTQLPDNTLRKSLTSWAIRWGIGIIAIIGILSQKPNLTWIWYIVAPIALLSLATIFFINHLSKQESYGEETGE